MRYICVDNPVALTDEQQQAVTYVRDNLAQKRIITFAGFAGTGKSTCLAYIKNLYPKFAVCAFTGKAANVLCKKGLPAKTIHSTIYNCEKFEDHFVFKLKKRSNLFGVTGFLVDEASMINKELFKDLKSFGLPIVFFGDHGQLEPIGASCNLMKNPDVKLETIHRNANSIAKFASFLREGNSAINWKSEDDRVKLVSRKNILSDDLLIFNQIICAFNKTRLNINNHMRNVYNYDGPPQKNERIICLKNNRTYNVFNGMQGRIVSLTGNNLTFKSEEGTDITLPIHLKQFNHEKLLEAAEYEKELGFFDYSYCITCHKAQGDEWDNVLVIEEKTSMWDFSRWAYTAASRAREIVWWAI